MKKLIVLLFFLFFMYTTVILKVEANTNEEILYKYGTTTPVTYYNTTNPVYLPTSTPHLKQEFRGAWVTTIWNLDMPKHTSKAQYQLEFTKILDTLDAYNMNVLLFQVRPKNDAMYESALNPWSRFMTGVEGVSPGWDPLPWMIEESHKRGIEFHAWFNPYRVFITDLSPTNYAAIHPEYVLKLTPGEEIFNPGIPQVQQFVIDTVMEVVNKYDIDGVHFDDYFYPYGGLASTYDENEYRLYNPNKYSLADWRRENVNHVIKTIKQNLTTVNTNQDRAVKLGMSPFGVWANKTTNPLGSNTKSGVQSYSELYADSYRWVKEEWIDYVVPQTYWEFTDANAPYADAVSWWANVVKGTDVNLFTGQSIYRYREGGWNTGPWANPDELGNQLLFNSKFPEITGSVYFRLNYLKEIGPQNLTYGQNELKTDFYKFNVLPPAFKNIDQVAPNAPTELKIQELSTGNQLSWKKENVKAYYVYRFNENEPINLNDISKVKDIIYPSTNELVTYLDSSATENVVYHYYVTAFDKAYNESQPSNISSNQITIPEPPVKEPNYLEINANIQTAKDLIASFNSDYQEKLNHITQVENLEHQLNSIMNDLALLEDEVKLYINDSETGLSTKDDLVNRLFSEIDINFTQLTDYDLVESKLDEINNIITEVDPILINNTSKINELTTKQTHFISRFDTYKLNTVPRSEDLNCDEMESLLSQLTSTIFILNTHKTDLSQTDSVIINQIIDLNNQMTILNNQYNDILPQIATANTFLTSYPTSITNIESISSENDSMIANFNILNTEMSSNFGNFYQRVENLRIQLETMKETDQTPPETPTDTPEEPPVDTPTEIPNQPPKENPIESPLLNFFDQFDFSHFNIKEVDPFTLAIAGTIFMVFILFISSLRRR